MRQLLLVRHGQSEQHLRDLTGGWTDTPLTDLGRQQARLTAQRLADLLQGEVVALYSSDLQRAAETARIIGQALGVEPVLRAELREMNNGKAANLSRADAKAIELPVTQPIADWQPYPDAESWRTMSNRIFRAMGNIDREVDQIAIVVTHGNTGIAAVQWWLGLAEAWERRISFELDACSISRFSVNRWGERAILKLNDTSHLDAIAGERDLAPQSPREISRRLLGMGRFIHLQAIRFRDAQGNERLWESAERAGSTRAVMLIAWLMPSERLVLIRQYRPPARGYVLEFPAGLIDGDETVEKAALRELHEETGYRGRIVDIGDAAYNTPGLSSEAAYPVLVEIDEHDPANHNPLAHPADGEEIDVILVKRDEIAEFLKAELSAGMRLDSKVAAYFAGLMG